MADRSRNGRLRKLGPRVLSATGRQEWLDRPSYRLEHVLSFAYNALGGAEQLRGSTLHKLRTKGRAALVRAL